MQPRPGTRVVAALCDREPFIEELARLGKRETQTSRDLEGPETRLQTQMLSFFVAGALGQRAHPLVVCEGSLHIDLGRRGRGRRVPACRGQGLARLLVVVGEERSFALGAVSSLGFDEAGHHFVKSRTGGAEERAVRHLVGQGMPERVANVGDALLDYHEARFLETGQAFSHELLGNTQHGSQQRFVEVPTDDGCGLQDLLLGFGQSIDAGSEKRANARRQRRAAGCLAAPPVSARGAFEGARLD